MHIWIQLQTIHIVITYNKHIFSCILGKKRYKTNIFSCILGKKTAHQNPMWLGACFFLPICLGLKSNSSTVFFFFFFNLGGLLFIFSNLLDIISRITNYLYKINQTSRKLVKDIKLFHFSDKALNKLISPMESFTTIIRGMIT